MDFKKKKCKIVFLLTHVPDPRINKRIKVIEDLGMDVTTVYWNRYQELFKTNENIQNITINVGDSSRKFFLRIIKGMLVSMVSFKFLIKLKPVLIYIDGIDLLFPAFIYKWMFHNRTRIILEIADLPGYHIYTGVLRMFLEKMVNFFIMKSNLVVFTSPFFWNDYYKDLLGNVKDIFILENLPEERIFKNFKKGRHEVFTIGFIGSIRYINQLKLLCEACEDIPGVKIFLAGGPIPSELKEFLSKYPKIEYFGPYSYERDIVDLYSKIDVVYAVYDTNSENVRIAIPNKLYEAIVCGLPIIVAKKTRLAEYVEDLGVGFAVSDRSVDELRELILKLKNERNIIETIEKKAEAIRHRYYWENVIEEFKRKILGICNY